MTDPNDRLGPQADPPHDDHAGNVADGTRPHDVHLASLGLDRAAGRGYQEMGLALLPCGRRRAAGMNDKVRYGPRFESALVYASTKHAEQHRKGCGAPYITHPLAVASLVGEFGGDEDQAIAALLHDVMEDCAVTRAELTERFGERVASMVAGCTDTTLRPKPPWRERKEKHLLHLRTLPPETKLVLACDKLHNATSIMRDLARASVGEAVWGRFRPSRPEVLWYYRSAVAALGDSWQHEVLDELGRVVAALASRVDG
jgi:GTP pyrophosphokinase